MEAASMEPSAEDAQHNCLYPKSKGLWAIVLGILEVQNFT